MIKLIASDLDGTLLKRGDKALSEDVRTAVMSALAQGRDFAVISGRDVPSLKTLFSFAGNKPYFVGCNGSVCVKDGKVLYSRPVPDVSVIKALKYARDGVKNVVFCAADTVYVYGTDGFKKYVSSLYKDGEVAYVTVTPDIKKPIYKISFFTDITSPAIDFSDFGVRLSYNKNGWTEYVNRFANKGDALISLQNRLGALKSNTASLGDSRDDCDMFAHSSLAFAFGEEAADTYPEAISVTSFTEAYEIIKREK